ncbi:MULTISPECIES: hypothetical protein [unclassified Solwaraspora]|uniref:hypothetical protein n=1 Tax=unclassified Solwaraspora TaxID=2627926 RepID=UPI00248C50C6|nr:MULTISPECIES: hypothetical protein [unclassified Solwaraspora]WBB95253.1 hypothetical protein O7553_17785 [Solwaraspora sp. WMMA2059]WBC20841.1 hypothetical protein O7543_29565 [Solwaraspora sp. WMMA2080]WJK37026.1 hypothetical protein O7610_12130 [Solwaraspora sp. WMMA2065]
MNDDDTTFDAALVHRLSRPARRPGLVDLGQARSVLTRHHTMPAGLPLAEVAARYVDVAAQQHAGPAAPIVYARPAPPPSVGPAPVGARTAGPAARAATPAGTATVAAGPAPTETGPTAPVDPVPVVVARRPSVDDRPSVDGRPSGPAGGPPVGASGPLVPARPAAEPNPVWTAAGSAVAGRPTPPVTSLPAAGRPLTIQRKAVAATLSTGGPGAGPAGRPASTGLAAATGAPGVTARPRPTAVPGPAVTDPADWSELTGAPGRAASGPHLTFRVPAAPDRPARPAAGVPSVARQRPPASAPVQVVTARPPAARPVPQLPLSAVAAVAPVHPVPGIVGVPSVAGRPSHPSMVGPARAATGHRAVGAGGRGPGAPDVGGQRPGAPVVDPPRPDRGVPQLPVQPAPRVDVGQVTEQVHGRIMRRLAVEAERRGVRR